jgi:hypothetical protein
VEDVDDAYILAWNLSGRASEFADAAELVLANAQNRQAASFSLWFLAARSIELSIKAFLVCRDQDLTSKIRKEKFRHDLGKILEKAKALSEYVNLGLDERDESVILNIDKLYQKKELEYFSGAFYAQNLPRPAELVHVASRIRDRVAIEIERTQPAAVTDT